MVTTAATAAPWPQEGSGPGHDGSTTETGVPTDGDVAWTLPSTRSGSPLVADGRLFHYGRLDVETSVRGTSSPPPRTPTALSELDGFSPDHEKYLFCRDARDGDVQWIRPVDFRSNWPVVEDGRVVAAGTGFVVAFSAADGEEQ